MSINMPQLIFQRAESAPPLPSQMSQAALSGGQSWGKGDFCLGGKLLLGGGEGKSQVSHPLYETLTVNIESPVCVIITAITIIIAETNSAQQIMISHSLVLAN